MIKENEIEELKKHLGSDGKLIISDDLTEKQIERYQFINSLNVDLVSILTRNTKLVDLDDEEASNTNTSDYDSDDDDVDVEFLDEDSDSSSNITEDEDATIDNLDSFF